MASEKQHGPNFRQLALIGYVGLCVILVALTLTFSLSEAMETRITLTPTASPTINPSILTLQADDGASDFEHGGGGRGLRHTPEPTPDSTPTPTLGR